MHPAMRASPTNDAAGHVTSGYAVLFSICAFAYLVTFALHHFLAPRFEPFPLKGKSIGAKA